jgi:hypothetical protein
MGPISSADYLYAVTANELLLTAILNENNAVTAGALALSGVNKRIHQAVLSHTFVQFNILKRALTAQAFRLAGAPFCARLKVLEKTKESFETASQIAAKLSKYGLEPLEETTHYRQISDNFIKVLEEVDDSLMPIVLSHLESFIHIYDNMNRIASAIAKRSVPAAIEWIEKFLPDETLSYLVEPARAHIEIHRVVKEYHANRSAVPLLESAEKLCQEYSSPLCIRHKILVAIARLQLSEDIPDAFEKMLNILSLDSGYNEHLYTLVVEVVNNDLQLVRKVLKEADIRPSGLTITAVGGIALGGINIFKRENLYSFCDGEIARIKAHDFSLFDNPIQLDHTVIERLDSQAPYFGIIIDYLIEHKELLFAFQMVLRLPSSNPVRSQQQDIIVTDTLLQAIILNIASSAKPRAFEHALTLANMIQSDEKYAETLFELAICCRFKDIPLAPIESSVNFAIIQLVNGWPQRRKIQDLTAHEIALTEHYLQPETQAQSLLDSEQVFVATAQECNRKSQVRKRTTLKRKMDEEFKKIDDEIEARKRAVIEALQNQLKNEST